MYPDRNIESAEGAESLAKELGVQTTDSPQASALADIPFHNRGSGLSIPEGRLMPGPHGGHLYIGPASSFQFANSVRSLVKKCNLDTLSSFDEAGLRRFLQAADFVAFNTAGSLAARVRGHPITSAHDELDEHGQASPVLPLALGWSPANLSTPRSALFRSDQLVDSLPPRDVCDHLLRAFFDHVHPHFAIFHRGSFQVLYESVWNRGDRTAEHDPGWVCALLMTLVLGAQAIETDTSDTGLSSTLQIKYLSFVLKDGLGRMVINASLTNVQALMLLGLYHHNAGERNAAWMLIGQAARMGIALGMQRDGEHGNFDPIERNVRRMVWWQLHMFEQTLSFTLGRPTCTDLPDVTVSLPDESVMDQGDFPHEYLAHAVALTELSIRIKRFVAAISNFEDTRRIAHVTAQADDLHRSLLRWYQALPEHLDPEYLYPTARLRRMLLSLHINYHYLLSVLGRPFLLARANQLVLSRTQAVFPLDPRVDALALMSRDGARGTLDLLRRLAEQDLLEPRVWLDFFYVHHATFVIGLYYLTRPIIAPEDQENRRAVSDMLIRAQRMNLAPTYRILCNIATQFAFIVDLAPDEEAALGPSSQVSDQRSAPPPHPGGQASLEELFSILPAPPGNVDTFADLYAFGMDDTSIPMDFFNLGLGDASSVPLGGGGSR